jgi:hypothetical protein
VKKRLPLLVMGALGVLLWKTAFFGLAAEERTLIFRLPVRYGDVRATDLQVWDGDELVQRSTGETPSGLMANPELKATLKHGTFKSIASVTLEGQATPRVFAREFEANGDVVTLEFK